MCVRVHVLCAYMSVVREGIAVPLCFQIGPQLCVCESVCFVCMRVCYQGGHCCTVLFSDRTTTVCV